MSQAHHASCVRPRWTFPHHGRNCRSEGFVVLMRCMTTTANMKMSVTPSSHPPLSPAPHPPSPTPSARHSYRQAGGVMEGCTIPSPHHRPSCAISTGPHLTHAPTPCTQALLRAYCPPPSLSPPSWKHNCLPAGPTPAARVPPSFPLPLKCDSPALSRAQGRGANTPHPPLPLPPTACHRRGVMGI